MKRLNGIAASQGIAIGPAFVYRPEPLAFKEQIIQNPPAEINRLIQAVEAVQTMLIALEEYTQQAIGESEAKIFEVHRMFLADPAFADEIKAIIEQEKLNAEAAVDRVSTELMEQFSAIDDEYFRQRAVDIKDVAQRLIRQLLGLEETTLASLKFPSIIIANDLTPSDTASLNRDMALGLCTEIGSSTSHTAILARSLGTPAVVGIGKLEISSGTTVIIDGQSGELIIDPDAETLAEYQTRQQARQRIRSREIALAQQPAITTDGHQVEVVANIGSVVEAEQALKMGAEGVGLLRTEFLFLQGDTLPSEEEQYRIYRAIADVFQQLPLIVRTLDVGGDKDIPSIDLAVEQNPMLGQRAIRLCLARPEIFQTQLRAILRAGHERNVKIMFPLIGSEEELHQALEQLELAKADLRARNLPHAEKPDVGIMIEVPSAAVLADVLAPQVDFFSIGTNDLAQYTLAVDRTNETVAHLADPLHPAVIRLIHLVIQAAHRHNKWVGLCGEMAGSPQAVPLLLGLGLDEFSMAAASVPSVKALLRTLSKMQAQEIAQRCLELPSLQRVRDFLQNSPVSAAA
ncbi:MAG: Phosphoenolpyruvate-protein phosphotransferase [Anaerolineae bacterium]|nr:Phosphoenolpyruvate-protein phosphotransferase [Anaerolineae bacterium]